MRYPAILLLICFSAGLYVGYSFPLFPYLAPAIVVGALSFWLLRRGSDRFVGVLLLMGCIFIGAQRMALAVHLSEQEEQSSPQTERIVHQVKSHLDERLRSAGLSDEELHLTEALLWGNREGLTREVKAKFRLTGGSHLLALSGMHLGIIFSILSVLCVRWVRFSRLRWIVIPLLVCGLWGYALLCGFPASLVRSAVMLTLVCVGLMMFRSVPLLHSLSLSALLILGFSPFLLFDIGFQLSCLAVLMIGLVYLPLQGAFRSWPWGLRVPSRLFFLSCCAQLGTIPLCAYYFHTLPLLGAVTGLLMVPLTSLLIYGGLLTLLFPIPLMASLVRFCVRAEMWIMDYSLQLFPNSVVNDLYPSLLQVILIYIMMLAGCIRIYYLAEDYRVY